DPPTDPPTDASPAKKKKRRIAPDNIGTIRPRRTVAERKAFEEEMRAEASKSKPQQPLFTERRSLLTVTDEQWHSFHGDMAERRVRTQTLKLFFFLPSLNSTRRTTILSMSPPPSGTPTMSGALPAGAKPPAPEPRLDDLVSDFPVPRSSAAAVHGDDSFFSPSEAGGESHEGGPSHPRHANDDDDSGASTAFFEGQDGINIGGRTIPPAAQF
ncbi:hypothetical protein V494_04193, partial [Pseudogymnoascus sp. VKM F-4513 (FW-928)]